MSATAAVPADPTSVPERGPRPATATVAGLLQLLIVLLAVALVAVAWIGYGNREQLIDRVVELVPSADPDVVAAERSGNLFGAVMLSVLFGLIALWFGTTFWPVWRGSNIARILATVGAGMQSALAVLFLCGGGFFGLMFLPLIASGPEYPVEGPFPPDAGPYGPEPFYEKLFELQSGAAGMWPSVAVGVGGALLTLLAGALLVLLVLPSSNRWFSPRPPGPSTTAAPVYYLVQYAAPGSAPAAPPTPPGQPATPAPPATPPQPPPS